MADTTQQVVARVQKLDEWALRVGRRTVGERGRLELEPEYEALRRQIDLGQLAGAAADAAVDAMVAADK